MQVRSVKPLPLSKMENLFNNLRIIVSPGLVSIVMCMYFYNILFLTDILTTRKNNILQDPNPNNLVESTTFYFEATKATLRFVHNELLNTIIFIFHFFSFPKEYCAYAMYFVALD